MTSIRQLDDRVVALIAAGEVVERPVSAVKELAENAIDAGATAITVEIQRGGFGLVRVRDDGAGIEPADLPLALARHATSKLQHADDLFDVRTLGFRGEALASIAAVSRLRIVTRTASHAAGRVIATTAGIVDDDGAVAAPVGTTVSVEDLFWNVPARHAFQRSPAGEARAIVQLVTQLALATPAIRWRVAIDGRDAVVSTPGNGSLREALVAVNGPAIAAHILDLPEIAETDGSLSVSGVTTGPAVHRNTRMHCTFVVNGRVVRSQSLSHAVEEAYHAMLPHGRHPIAAICITVPPSEVDVNVHPTKLEVRLRRERLVYARVRDSVRRALEGHAPAPTVAPTVPRWGDPSEHLVGGQRPRTGFWLPPNSPSSRGDGGAAGQVASSAGFGAEGASLDVPRAGRVEGLEGVTSKGIEVLGSSLNAPREALAAASDRATEAEHDYPPSEVEATAGATWSNGSPAPLSSWRPLGQVGLTYVVVESPDGMYLIDQHSAHERIQYEELKSASARPDPLQRQSLLVPEVIDLTAAQGVWLRENVGLLSTLGYDLEPFSDPPGVGVSTSASWASDTWLIRAVPWSVAARGRRIDIGSLIDGLVEREYGDGPIEDQTRWAVACHSSVRAGDRLSPPEMQSLLDQLSRCDLRQTCPHGRPTMIHLSHSQLAREFGRSAPARSVM